MAQAAPEIIATDSGGFGRLLRAELFLKPADSQVSLMPSQIRDVRTKEVLGFRVLEF